MTQFLKAVLATSVVIGALFISRPVSAQLGPDEEKFVWDVITPGSKELLACFGIKEGSLIGIEPLKKLIDAAIKQKGCIDAGDEAAVLKCISDGVEGAIKSACQEGGPLELINPICEAYRLGKLGKCVGDWYAKYLGTVAEQINKFYCRESNDGSLFQGERLPCGMCLKMKTNGGWTFMIRSPSLGYQCASLPQGTPIAVRQQCFKVACTAVCTQLMGSTKNDNWKWPNAPASCGEAFQVGTWGKDCCEECKSLCQKSGLINP